MPATNCYILALVTDMALSKSIGSQHFWRRGAIHICLANTSQRSADEMFACVLFVYSICACEHISSVGTAHGRTRDNNLVK